MQKTITEVQNFLRQLKEKINVFGIFFINRDKKEEALKAIGITPDMREKIVAELVPADYVEFKESLTYGDLWVFGKNKFNQMLYIKLSLGRENNNAICVSFHIAEHDIKYAFKDS